MKQYPECLLNSDKNNPSNQIIPGRELFYVVGQDIVDERLMSTKQTIRDQEVEELLNDLPQAQRAFVYAPEDHLDNPKKIDIGVVIIDIPASVPFGFLLCPIDLPDKG